MNVDDAYIRYETGKKGKESERKRKKKKKRKKSIESGSNDFFMYYVVSRDSAMTGERAGVKSGFRRSPSLDETRRERTIVDALRNGELRRFLSQRMRDPADGASDETSRRPDSHRGT